MFLLELLHSLLFEFSLVLLCQLVFGDYHLAVDGLADFLCGAVSIPIVSSKRIDLIIRHNRHTLTLDFIEDVLSALREGLGWVCIADSKQIVTLCTAIEIVADSLDKIFR